MSNRLFFFCLALYFPWITFVDMELPDDVQVYETISSYYWFEPDGILCTVSKRNAPRLNPADLQKQIDDFYALHGNRGKKFCMLIDAQYAQPSTKKERDITEQLFNSMTIAMAVIVHNVMGRMLVNLFLGLKPPRYPMKMFSPKEEEKARDWLRQYM